MREVGLAPPGRALATLLCVALLSVAPSSHADPADEDDKPLADDTGETRKGFGLGLVLGEPTGLTAKVFFDVNSAAQLHAAYDFTDQAFDFILDYLYHIDAIELDTPNFELPIYLGVGIKFGQLIGSVRGNVTLGVRLILGIAVEFKTMPVELFAEIVPVLRLTPVTQPDVDGGVGIRYFF